MADILEIPFVDTQGCQWVTGHTQRMNVKTKKMETVSIYCKKHRANANSALCPHHEVMLAASENRRADLAKKRKLKADKEKMNEEALALSPLRANRDEEAEERKTGYEK